MSEDNGNEPGLYLYGITRARGWRGAERRIPNLQRIRFRDIEAVVRQSEFVLPDDHAVASRDHQDILEKLNKRNAIMPAPVGVVFKHKRALIRLLQEEYLIIDEGLALLDNNYELRLHISGNAVGKKEDALEDEAMAVYAELRRFARAAVPFKKLEGKLASCAFLVERTSWADFVERIEDFAEHHKSLTFDITGPWPAFDFVRIVT